MKSKRAQSADDGQPQNLPGINKPRMVVATPLSRGDSTIQQPENKTSSNRKSQPCPKRTPQQLHQQQPTAQVGSASTSVGNTRNTNSSNAHSVSTMNDSLSESLARSTSENSRLHQTVVYSAKAGLDVALIDERSTSAVLPCFLRPLDFESYWPGLTFVRAQFPAMNSSSLGKGALIVWEELDNLTSLGDATLPTSLGIRDTVEIDGVHAVTPLENAHSRQHAAAIPTSGTKETNEAEADQAARDRELAWRKRADPSLQAYHLCDEPKVLRSEGGSPPTTGSRGQQKAQNKKSRAARRSALPTLSTALRKACERVARAARKVPAMDRSRFVLSLPWNGRHSPGSRPTPESNDAFWALLLRTKLVVVEAAATRQSPPDSKFRKKAKQLSVHLVFLQLLFSWIRGKACTTDLFECAVIGLPARPKCLTMLDPDAAGQHPLVTSPVRQVVGSELVLPRLTVCTTGASEAAGGQGGDRALFPTYMGTKSPLRVLLSHHKGLFVQQRRAAERDAVSAVCAAMHSFSDQITELKTDVAGLKTDVAGLKTDFAGLKADVQAIKEQNAENMSTILAEIRHLRQGLSAAGDV